MANRLVAFILLIFIVLGSCKRRGCMENVACVDNFDKKAVKSGDCSGCTKIGAANYCPEADIDNGQCRFTRKLYSDYSTEGWIDVWVSDSTDTAASEDLVYE